MRRILLFAIIIVLGLGLYRPTPTQAQTLTNIPLVMLIDGDLWKWNPQSNALTQLTAWRYNFKPVMSPKGDWVAYKSWAQITVEAIAADAPMNPTEPPGNIWLIDPLTGDATRIADQPADARFGRADGDERFIARSNPVWSPDGTEIAWTEFWIPEYTYQLVIYTVATQATRVVVNTLAVGYEQYGPSDVYWGRIGIAYPAVNYNSTIENFEETVHFYNTNGRVINTITYPVGDSPVHGYFWFTGTDFTSGVEDGFAVIDSAVGLPTLLNPQTGRSNVFMGMLVGYSGWQNPAQSLYLSFEMYQSDFNYGLTWRPLTANGRFFDSIGTSLSYFDTFSKVAISPDGQSVAYIADDNTVLVWTSGRTIELPVSNVSALAWSPILWTTNYPVSG